MNAIDNPWHWWQAALAGRFGPIHENAPQAGFYRTGDDAVAIWRGDDGAMIALRAGRQVDAAEVWTWCCRKPISHALYKAVTAGGQWPESVAAEVEAARPEPGVGHNSGTPEDMARDELDALDRAWADWLASIGGKIASEDHDAKAATFQSRFAELSKKLDGVREETKRPHLTACREIDAAWKPIIARADDGKKKVGAALTPYRVERQRLRDEAERARLEAERKAREDAQRAAAAAAMAGEPPPPAPEPAPAAQPIRKAATGLRTYKVLVIDDLAAVASVILKIEKPPAEFVDACKLVARRLMDAGVPVPGARIVEEKRA